MHIYALVLKIHCIKQLVAELQGSQKSWKIIFQSWKNIRKNWKNCKMSTKKESCPSYGRLRLVTVRFLSQSSLLLQDNLKLSRTFDLFPYIFPDWKICFLFSGFPGLLGTLN